jgi:threonine aldolase
MDKLNFQSDNQSSVFPEIIDYLKIINEDSSPAYGADEVTKLATKMLIDFFETNLKVIFVSSGTAANSIALSTICPPYGGILCSDNAHIGGDECGAPEFFTSGAKLLPIPTVDALITEKNLIIKMNNHGLHGIHEVLPSAISLTQASELGTIYTPDDIHKITHTAKKKYNLKTHMDGARFSNACASLNVKPAELSWKNGIDILSLGTTKNGTISCEAIIVFNQKIIDDLERRQKRTGHLWSKNKFVSGQIIKWLEDDNWLNAARKANFYAQDIMKLLKTIDNVTIEYNVDVNMVFACIPIEIQNILRENNVMFNHWYGKNNLTRFVSSWDTKVAELSSLKSIINNIIS